MYKIFGKNMCPSCVNTKTLLESLGLDYQYLSLGEDFTLPELFSLTPTPPRSFPQVFKGDDYVGGLKELKLLLGV